MYKFAYYKLHVQLKKQIDSFLKGFHEILDPSWLSMFSHQEIQEVISGKDKSFDVDELRLVVTYVDIVTQTKVVLSNNVTVNHKPVL